MTLNSGNSLSLNLGVTFMNNDALGSLRKEVREIQDSHTELSPGNAFVAWFLRSLTVEDEGTARAAIVGNACDKAVDPLHIDHDDRPASLVEGKQGQNANAGPESRSDVLALPNLGGVLAKTEKREFKALLGDAHAAVEGLLEKVRNAVQRIGYHLVADFMATGKVSSAHREKTARWVDEGHLVSFDVHAGARCSLNGCDLWMGPKRWFSGSSPAGPSGCGTYLISSKLGGRS